MRTGAPPPWVQWLDPPRAAGPYADKAFNGQEARLLDTQVDGASSDRFCHVVKKIVSESGVQSGANLSFVWDPSFQEISIHRILIHRGQEDIEQLDVSKFKIVQQEQDLNRQIYNGTLSALIFLNDVRVGDEIDFAWTVRGANPVLNKHFSDAQSLKLSVPVQRLRYRLVWPRGRHLTYRVHGAEADPEIRSRGQSTAYVWDFENVPQVVAEDHVPAWIPQSPWVQVSQFADWSEVAAWAVQLYGRDSTNSTELRAIIAKLSRSAASPEETIQGALDFVQNDIRYLGIEFGPNSYHPMDPGAVLARRFGDCKDKAFLLCALLRGLGYDAVPVLVSTGMRQGLPHLLPAPHDFDHVIVRVVASGSVYFVDPTSLHQRGPLLDRYLPDFGFGLLVRPGERDLIALPAPGIERVQSRTLESFNIGPPNQASRLQVITTARGADAIWLRTVLASIGREELAKSYLNDYARQYPGIIAAAPLGIEDAPDQNLIKLIHNYSISNLWSLTPDKKRYGCQFSPLGILAWLGKPQTSIRSMPLEISFPRLRQVRTTLNLPVEFPIEPFTNVYTGPAIEVRAQASQRGRQIVLEYQYRALTNFVPVALTAAHVAALDRVDKAIGYSLSWADPRAAKGGGFNLLIFLVVALFALLAAAAAVMIYRYECNLPLAAGVGPPPILEARITGLGGWLIIVALNLIGSSIWIVISTFRNRAAYSLSSWHALTSPESARYQAAWGPLLITELLFRVALLAGCALLLVFFFQKRKAFPRCFVGLLILSSVYGLADHFGSQYLLKTTHPTNAPLHIVAVMKAVIAPLIWGLYMRNSRRVRATFIH